MSVDTVCAERALDAQPICPLDNERMRPWLYVPVDYKKAKPNPFSSVVRCPKCSYGRVYPPPPDMEVPEFYKLERYYTQGHSHFTPGRAQTFLDKLRVHLAWRVDRGVEWNAEWIREHLPPSTHSICDMGCGDGAIAASLANLGFSVLGVEPDPAAIGNSHSSRIEVASGTAEKLCPSIQGRTFDALIMHHVLEHCIDPALALRNARSLLRKEGSIICEVPNNQATSARWAGAAWEMLDVPRHLHFFSRSNLARLLESNGFKVKSVHYVGYTRAFSNCWIATEQALHDALLTSATEKPRPTPVRNSTARAWRLLVRTAFARDRYKYDSIRIVAIT